MVLDLEGEGGDSYTTFEGSNGIRTRRKARLLGFCNLQYLKHRRVEPRGAQNTIESDSLPNVSWDLAVDTGNIVYRCSGHM